MKLLIPFFLVIILSLEGWTQAPCLEVVGYYPSWQWYDRNKLVAPSTIDYSRYTHLQYAFINVDADGHLQLTDPWADKNLLLGTIDWGSAPAGYDIGYDWGNASYHLPNTSLSYYAHLNNVKLLISIGGWTLSANFPEIAGDPMKRAVFASDCAAMCSLYNLDGIDIDWEYPSNIAQGNNFQLLLQEVRDALDEAEPILNRELYLSAAVSAGNNMAYIPWSAVSEILDMINLMSYDYYGTWDVQLNHNAPLYDPEQGIEGYSCNGSVQRLLSEFNVSPSKINMGIPFYGRSQMSNAAILFGTGNGIADNLHFGSDEGTPLYYNVLLQEAAFEEHWDAAAEVPYKIALDGTSFLSYDDEASVALKAQYIVDQGLRGAIIWEITGDYIESAPGSGVIVSTPLANQLHEVFCNQIEVLEHDTNLLKVFPNPAADRIQVHLGTLQSSAIVILNIVGQHCMEQVPGSNLLELDISHLTPGCYFIRTSEGVQPFIKQ
jgi:GH18 family chitinase